MRIKRSIPKFICSLLFIFIASSSVGQTKNSFTPTFTESTETTHKIPNGQEYTFGYLEVLENRNSFSRKTIKFPVYIFKSRNLKPKTDPIIYTVGGPGSSTMSSAQYMNYYKYLDDRDFILVEQRGTYYAQPHLDCPEWSQVQYLSYLPGFDETKSKSLFEQAALECNKRLTNKRIDLNGYNTNEIAADIEDLRKTLKIDKYNLLTISYSTKIAQVLIRDYPEAIRSVVMDSPLPLEVNYDEESTGNLLEAVDKLLSDCESEEKCNKAFPNIKKNFSNYLKDRTENPLVVSIDNPNNEKKETFLLKGKDLIAVFTSASTSNVVSVPYEINKLLQGDLSTLKEQLSKLFTEPNDNSGSGIGMRLSVWCAEEYPFTSKKIIETETNRYPQIKGLSPAVFKSRVCEIWGVKKVSKIENKPVSSDIPVLLISGEYDNETPVKWASSMKENLANSQHLIFIAWKHTPTTNWGNQCAMIAANEFFNNPNLKPNPECLAEIKTPEFKTE